MLQKGQNSIKIIILGDPRVGKTSLLNQYVNAKFSLKYIPTIGADFITKEVIIDNKKVTLEIWDTAKQDRFQTYGHLFYQGADCCILVYDITNLSTFESLECWRDDFILQGKPKNPENFPFVVFGNKLDKDSERKVTSEKAQKWCKSLGNIQYAEVSAQNSTNIQQAFLEVARIAGRQENEEVFGHFPILNKCQNQKQEKQSTCY